MKFPPLSYQQPVAGAGGAISSELHRWLQLIARALHGPFIGQAVTGVFVVADGQYAIQAEEVVLSGTEEPTLEGDAVLVIV